MFSPTKLLASLTLSVLMVLPLTASAADAGGALETFKTRHGLVVELVKQHAPDDQLQAQIDQLLNYRVLAEKSLGGATHYEQRCAPQCDDFESLLTDLIRRNYLDRIRADKDYRVEYVGEEVKEKYTKVVTRVKYTSNGRPEEVEVVYKMAKNDAGVWMAVDLVTDGVSLKQTYKYEFKQTIQQGGITLLVDKLRRKLAEITAKARG
jgi:ABC-type transporter MlaC component